MKYPDTLESYADKCDKLKAQVKRLKREKRILIDEMPSCWRFYLFTYD